MKRIISTVISMMAIFAAFTACNTENPDGACEITSFSLHNSSTGEKISGAIDQTDKTITVVVPAADMETEFIVYFTTTEYDEVSTSGYALHSGMVSIWPTDGMKLDVMDKVSGLSTTYMLIVKSNE